MPSLKTFTATVPNQLLLSSLLEYLCSVYEKNPQRSRCLFKLLCEELADMKLIAPFSFRDEFSTVRLQHTTAIAELLQAAHSSLYSKAFSNVEANLPGEAPACSRGGSSNCEKELAFDSRGSHTYASRTNECLLPGQTSRYLSEFEEVKRLGKGGYGKVYKVRNKLDGQFYAIKRILIKKVPDCMKILREVKVLAGLQHPNIVGYHTAWLEHVRPCTQRSDRATFRNLPALERPSDCEDERDHVSQQNMENSTSYIVFADSSSAVGNATSEASKEPLVHLTGIKNGCIQRDAEPVMEYYREEQCERLKSFKAQVEVPCSEDNKAISTRDFSHGSSKKNGAEKEESNSSLDSNFSLDEEQFLLKDMSLQVQSEAQFHLMLYIQMQFCELSLREWILDRNARLGEGLVDPYQLVNAKSTLKMFWQLLEGVRYIHAMGIMHRDLKPRNIFLRGPDLHVRIGDFGLACGDIIVDDKDSWLTTAATNGSSHTSGVGTCLYASPEQLQGSHYDFTSDMYSVGIILLELFQPFGTEMERAQILTTLREGQVPDAFKHQWPVHTKYVKLLTSKTSVHRPSAAQVLESELFHGTEKVIHDLRKKVEEQEEEIEKLKEKIQLLMREKDEQRPISQESLGSQL